MPQSIYEKDGVASWPQERLIDTFQANCESKGMLDGQAIKGTLLADIKFLRTELMRRLRYHEVVRPKR